MPLLKWLSELPYEMKCCVIMSIASASLYLAQGHDCPSSPVPLQVSYVLHQKSLSVCRSALEKCLLFLGRLSLGKENIGVISFKTGAEE